MIEECKKNEIATRFSIILDSVEYEVFGNLKEDCYDNGNIIGNMIAKSFEFDIEESVYLAEKEFEVYHIVNDVKQKIGTFISVDLEINDTTKITNCYAVDYVLKTMVSYESKLDYESNKITLFDIWVECCELAGIKNTLTSINAGDMIINTDQFTHTGVLIHDVFKEVAKCTLDFIVINENDEATLVLQNETNYIIENYEELEDKRDTQPYTKLVYGQDAISGQEGIYFDQSLIDTYGKQTLTINDSLIAYTYEMRQYLAENNYNKIKLFGYSSFVADNTFMPYLKLGDRIQYKTSSGELTSSIVLRKETDIQYKGVSFTIEAPSITKSTIDYVEPSSQYELLKTTRIIVDRDSQRIDLLAQKSESMEAQINSADETDKYYYNSNGDVASLNFNGNCEQYLTDNLLKPLSTPRDDGDYWQNLSLYATPLENGWLNITRDNTSSNQTWVAFYQKNIYYNYNIIKSSTKYKLIVEIENIDTNSTDKINLLQTDYNNEISIFKTNVFVEIKTGIYEFEIETKDEILSTYLFGRNFISLYGGQHCNFDIRMSLYEIDSESNTYLDYTVPSPDFEVPIYTTNNDNEISVFASTKNLLKPLSTPRDDGDYWQNLSLYATPLENGWINFNCENNTSGNIWNSAYVKNGAITQIKENTKYKIVIEFANFKYEGLSNQENNYIIVNESYSAYHVWNTSKYIKFWYDHTTGTNIENKTYVFEATTLESFDGMTRDLKIALGVTSGSKLNVDFRIAIYEIDNAEDTYTDYELIENKIYLPEGEFMGSIGNVRDELNLNSGTITKRIGRLILDGNKFDTETYIGTNGNYKDYRINIYEYKQNVKLNNSSVDILCNKLECVLYGLSTGYRERNAVMPYYNSDTRQVALICLKNDILSSNTYDGLYQWFGEQYASGDPVIVYYELKTPYEIPISYDEIHTTDGDGSVYLLNANNVYMTYYTNSYLNGIFSTKTDMANIIININGIEQRVSSNEQIIDSQGNLISELENTTKYIQDNSMFRFEIEEAFSNGSVSSLENTTVLIDMNGITVDNSNSSTSFNVDSDGLEMINKTSSTNQDQFYVKYDEETNTTTTYSRNLIVGENLDVGKNTRIQDFTDENNNSGGGLFLI